MSWVRGGRRGANFTGVFFEGRAQFRYFTLYMLKYLSACCVPGTVLGAVTEDSKVSCSPRGCAVAGGGRNKQTSILRDSSN